MVAVQFTTDVHSQPFPLHSFVSGVAFTDVEIPLVPLSTYRGELAVFLTTEQIQILAKSLCFALVGKFLRVRPSIKALRYLDKFGWQWRKGQWQLIGYEEIPNFCHHCQKAGHSKAACLVKNPQLKSPNPNHKSNDEGKTPNLNSNKEGKNPVVGQAPKSITTHDKPAKKTQWIPKTVDSQGHAKRDATN
ncbi:hypothetical protein ACH5RR_032550 [Cinchona calisaya]|uniref:Uncharacterized protein n=1 Tax=Cinchona calisaya TaxID=153742 RepID=A0ABD2YNN1_9GENT